MTKWFSDLEMRLQSEAVEKERQKRAKEAQMADEERQSIIRQKHFQQTLVRYQSVFQTYDHWVVPALTEFFSVLGISPIEFESIGPDKLNPSGWQVHEFYGEIVFLSGGLGWFQLLTGSQNRDLSKTTIVVSSARTPSVISIGKWSLCKAAYNDPSNRYRAMCIGFYVELIKLHGASQCMFHVSAAHRDDRDGEGVPYHDSIERRSEDSLEGSFATLLKSLVSTVKYQR